MAILARGAFLLALLLVFPLRSQAYSSPMLEALQETTLSVRALANDLGAIPRGAQRVKLLSLRLIASCDGDVRIREIRARHFGLGDASDLRGVYILRGFERITRPVAISSDDQVVSFRTKGLRLEACSQTHIDIAADFSADAAVGAEHRFEIQGAEDIVTDAETLAGKFPLRNIAKIDVAPLPAGALTVTFLPVQNALDAVTEHTLAKMQVAADTESHQMLYSVTLTNEGTAKGSDLRSLYLTTKQGGRPLTGTALTLDDKQVTLTFASPYFLKRGKDVTFLLRGRPYTRDETVRFALKEPSDLHAIPMRQGGRTLGTE